MISVVIPTYNERENIASLIKEVQAVFDKNRLKGEILVVDDSSPDGTAGIVRSLGHKDRRVRLLVRKHKDGYGAAVQYGYGKARGDVFICMDADHSHDPKAIPVLLGKVREGYGLVLGSRNMRGGSSDKPLVQRSLSIAWSWIVRALTGVGASDMTTGFRAVRSSVARRVPARSKGIGFLVESVLLAAQQGVRIAEVPIQFKERTKGRSKTRLIEEGAGEAAVLVGWLRGKGNHRV